MANSSVMFFICGLAIIVVLVQAAIFFRAAWKEAIRIGFTKADLLKVVKSSTVFSIVPSLPIIISYMILLPARNGQGFPGRNRHFQTRQSALSSSRHPHR